VGRGSATVLELPNGQSLLYDLGTSYPWDVGTGVILPFLKDRGIRYLERIYISHANLDHFSGMDSVLDGMPTGPVVLNRCFERAGIRESSPARHLVNILCRRQHPVEWLESAPRKWDDDTGVTFEVLWPRDCKNLPDTWSANDTSTVLRLTYAGRSLLLTGDIEEAAQRALIERGDLHADVLVLPHHGGVATTLPTFLAAVAPQAVIRSHHERTAETINGLPEVVGDIPCYNTADVGAVRVEWDSNGVQVHPFMD
jgi:competence protein ComEC